MTRVFLDTSFAIATAVMSDQNHRRAVELAHRIRSEGMVLITTRAITLEIGNSLSRLRYRKAAVELLTALEDDPGVEVVPMIESHYRRALDLFQARPDKEWGLIDCLSFVVMRERGLTEALTADEHFRQAGFRALLLEP